MTVAATRFSGDIKIGIVYSESEAQYACQLSMPGVPSVFEVVGEPAILEHAVDSPEAFDSVAHAALSFSAADDLYMGDVDGHAAYNCDGWHIGRTEKERWPNVQ